MRPVGVRLVALACVGALLTAACGDEAEPAPSETTVEADTGAQSATDGDSGQSSSASSEDDAAASAPSSSDSDGAASGSADDDTVSIENPGAEGVPFDGSRNAALAAADPLQVVRWAVKPSISAGELVAEGELEQGAILFSPWEGDGSAFSVFYKGHEESLVELLPDLGPMQIWDTLLTVAPTEMEIEGPKFRLRAYSPLFMDVGPTDLEMRVYGYDQSGADALLAVEDIGAR